MTALERASRVNYCDECENFVILNDAPYCKVDGKLIHPTMMVRGTGSGPAMRCKKRERPKTNSDLLRQLSDDDLADVIFNELSMFQSREQLLTWLGEEVVT